MGRTAPQKKSSAGFGAIGTCAGLLLSAVLLMVAWNWTRAVAGADGLPQIVAPDGPFRMAPADPGGQAVPYVDMKVYSLIETPGKPPSPAASPEPRTVTALHPAPPLQLTPETAEAEGEEVVSQADAAPVAADRVPVPEPRPSQRSQ